jgi:hypothetical protein
MTVNAYGKPGESPTNTWPAQLDEEARADALDVLADLLRWQLVPKRWERVERIVDSAAQAVVAGDADALRDAIGELELAGPVRVTRIGATPLVPPPERVRDRANHLVHSLGGASQRDTSRPADSTTGPEDDGGRKPTG